MTNNISSNEQQYIKPSTNAIVGGVVVGGLTSFAIRVPHAFIAPETMKKMQNICNNLSKDEFKQVDKALDATLNKSGLKQKGVEILKYTKKNAKKITSIINKEIEQEKFIPKFIRKIRAELFNIQLKMGMNAFYSSISNKVVLPEKKLGLAAFHEMGHAMNANMSKIGKALQKCRKATILTVPIALIALLKTKKAPGEQPKDALDKTTTFVKNNAGKLTFAACLPMLIEEGLASIKGNKFAKQFLKPELAQKVAKTNALAFSTYLLAAVLGSIGIHYGVKAKDSIARNKLASEN